MERLGENAVSGASTARKKGVMGMQGSSARRIASNVAGKAIDHKPPMSTRPSAQDQDTQRALQGQQTVLSLKDTYVDLMRNQKLDFENFYEPSVVNKCIEQKREITQKLSKYKTKIWKPDYTRITTQPKQIRKEPLNNERHQMINVLNKPLDSR